MDQVADPTPRSAYALLCDMDQHWRQLGAVAASGTRVWSGLAVRIGEHRIVVPRNEISEIIPRPALTRIPHAAAWVHGIANHRGALLPVFDMGGLLGMDEPASRAWVLALNAVDTPAGFAVDEVFGHRDFTAGDQRPNLIGSVPTSAHDGLLGVFVRDGDQWAAFSLKKLIHDGVLRAASASGATAKVAA